MESRELTAGLLGAALVAAILALIGWGWDRRSGVLWTPRGLSIGRHAGSDHVGTHEDEEEGRR